jgi:DNA-binding XRE family transcriptional regulator
MKEWGASRILSLRKHAGMTQVQFAQWLGVSTKQVKYLEHQRRNPSGPTRRLLDILAVQSHFNGTDTVLVLGTNLASSKAPPRMQQRPRAASAQTREEGNGTTGPSELTLRSVTAENPPEAFASPLAPDDDAFVWR